MHMANCNCPQCRGGASSFEFEAFGSGQSEEILGEQEELELAMELLNVQNEQELEQFLGSVFSAVGRGLKSVGSFAAKNVLPVLGGALKQIAKTALPIAGGALGSFIPIPGVGTALGRALGGVVADALEMEVSGLNHEDAALERARLMVRLTAGAAQQAAAARGSGSPESIARTALTNAATRYLPGTAGAMAAMIPTQGQMLAPLAAGSARAGQSGTWRRHGQHIIVEGL